MARRLALLAADAQRAAGTDSADGGVHVGTLEAAMDAHAGATKGQCPLEGAFFDLGAKAKPTRRYMGAVSASGVSR